MIFGRGSEEVWIGKRGDEGEIHTEMQLPTYRWDSQSREIEKDEDFLTFSYKVSKAFEGAAFTEERKVIVLFPANINTNEIGQ